VSPVEKMLAAHLAILSAGHGAEAFRRERKTEENEP